MTKYATQIERIRQTQSLNEIVEIVNEFPARAMREGGILYSNWVGDVHAHTIAEELAEKTGLPIIDNTPRGLFLGNEDVEIEIKDAASRIFEQQGQAPGLAREGLNNSA